MKRKRFAKLLMAEGYSRNEANEIADEAIRDGMSYESAWRASKALRHLLSQDVLCRLEEELAEIIPTIIQRVVETVPVVIDAMKAAVETIKRFAEEQAERIQGGYNDKEHIR